MTVGNLEASANHIDHSKTHEDLLWDDHHEHGDDQQRSNTDQSIDTKV